MHCLLADREIARATVEDQASVRQLAHQRFWREQFAARGGKL
jgi:hypothetical protein